MFELWAEEPYHLIGQVPQDMEEAKILVKAKLVYFTEMFLFTYFCGALDVEICNCK